MSRPGKGQGVTLIELVVTLLVAGILIAIAIPSFNLMFQKNRLKGAAERLAAETQLARAEALARRSPVTISISVTSSSDWCIGIDEEEPGDGSTGCDCNLDDPTESDACALFDSDANANEDVVRVSRVEDFKGVAIQGNDVDATFEPVRGMPTGAVGDWPIIFGSAAGQEVGVRLTVLGSVHLCSPAGSGNIWDYPACN